MIHEAQTFAIIQYNTNNHPRPDPPTIAPRQQTAQFHQAHQMPLHQQHQLIPCMFMQQEPICHDDVPQQH
jgi:hypothetical protein